MVKSTLNWKLLDRDPLDRWVHENGRIALMGDACHPMLVQSNLCELRWDVFLTIAPLDIALSSPRRGYGGQSLSYRDVLYNARISDTTCVPD